MGGAFPIGEVARRAGLKVPTIRYYEQIGLLPPLPRSEGNRRCYHDSDVRRLVFIRHARELGFEVEAIRPCSLCRTSRRTLAGRLMRLSASISRRVDSRFNGRRLTPGASAHLRACLQRRSRSRVPRHRIHFQLRSPSECKSFTSPDRRRKASIILRSGR